MTLKFDDQFLPAFVPAQTAGEQRCPQWLKFCFPDNY
jgi:hypothetical protein